MALAATGDYQKRTIGRLTDVEQIRNIASLTEVAGIKPARMQSFGEYIAHDYLAKIKSLRS